MTDTVPQTNLQLYAQLMRLGFDDAGVALVNRAYLFAARQTSLVIRGSGKPFACHLVGTAALIAEAGEGAVPVTASLLHAAYQERVPFPGGRVLTARRDYLREHFGADVETLVHDYHQFECADLGGYSDDDLRQRRTVVMMRLADEIEDLLDHGVAMHGRPGDDATVAGSAASRRLQKASLAPELLRAARVVDAPSLHRRLAVWLDRTASAAWPAGLRSGEYSSFQADRPEA
jgi:hypothetical protein